jgi:hypothetical protein
MTDFKGAGARAATWVDMKIGDGTSVWHERIYYASPAYDS